MSDRTPEQFTKTIRYCIKRGWELPNLRYANLEDADLEDADLEDANLEDANLHGADLRGANLRGAKLYGAKLYGANLHGANLRGVNLEDAKLYGADLRGAELPLPIGMTSSNFDVAISQDIDGNFTYYAGCFSGNASEMVAKTLAVRNAHQAKQVFYRCLSFCADTADEQVFLDATSKLNQESESAA